MHQTKRFSEFICIFFQFLTIGQNYIFRITHQYTVSKRFIPVRVPIITNGKPNKDLTLERKYLFEPKNIY